jgi:hypothetical protein
MQAEQIGSDEVYDSWGDSRVDQDQARAGRRLAPEGPPCRSGRGREVDKRRSRLEHDPLGGKTLFGHRVDDHIDAI